jgi:hypothetical protein
LPAAGATYQRPLTGFCRLTRPDLRLFSFFRATRIPP